MTLQIQFLSSCAMPWTKDLTVELVMALAELALLLKSCLLDNSLTVMVPSSCFSKLQIGQY